MNLSVTNTPCSGISEMDLSKEDFHSRFHRSTPDEYCLRMEGSPPRLGESATPRPRIPRLNLDTKVPFEHKVILFDELHPRLQECVKTIHLANAAAVSDSSTAFLFCGGFLLLPGPAVQIAVLTSAMLTKIGMSINATVKKCRLSERVEKASRGMSEQRRHTISWIARKLTSPSPAGVPYLLSSALTKGMGELIDDIASGEESPFALPDTRAILTRYHYGVVDNAGNLVLLKYPGSDKAQKQDSYTELRLRFLWHLPFQRAKFLINRPRMRQKQQALVPAVGSPI